MAKKKTTKKVAAKNATKKAAPKQVAETPKEEVKETPKVEETPKEEVKETPKVEETPKEEVKETPKVEAPVKKATPKKIIKFEGALKVYVTKTLLSYFTAEGITEEQIENVGNLISYGHQVVIKKGAGNYRFALASSDTKFDPLDVSKDFAAKESLVNLCRAAQDAKVYPRPKAKKK